MVDLESIYADLCEYLSGERFRANPPREPREPINFPMEEEGGEEEQRGDVLPDEGDDPNIEDPNGDELVIMALNGIPLNGERVDRTDVHPEVHPVPIGPTGPENEDDRSDDDMGAEDRCRRYLSSSQSQTR